VVSEEDSQRDFEAGKSNSPEYRHGDLLGDPFWRYWKKVKCGVAEVCYGREYEVVDPQLLTFPPKKCSLRGLSILPIMD